MYNASNVLNTSINSIRTFFDEWSCLLPTAGSLTISGNEFYMYRPATEKVVGHICSAGIMVQPEGSSPSGLKDDAMMRSQRLAGRSRYKCVYERDSTEQLSRISELMQPVETA